MILFLLTATADENLTTGILSLFDVTDNLVVRGPATVGPRQLSRTHATTPVRT